MLGPGGLRPVPQVRRRSSSSTGSQRQVSTVSGSLSSQAASCRHQSSHAVRVFDAEGKDVTPCPLFCSDSSSAIPRQGRLSPSSTCFGATGFPSSSSTQHLPGVNVGSFSRLCGSSSTCLLNTTTAKSTLTETAESGSQQDATATVTDMQMRREKVTEEPAKEDLDRRVDIYLSETETLWLLDVPSVVVSTESEDAGRVLERNKLYADVCKSRAGNDHFVEKMMQTLNEATKNKEVQCDKVLVEDKGMMVTSWDLYDSFNVLEMEPKPRAGGSRVMTRKSCESHTTQGHNQPVAVSSDRGSTTCCIRISESAALARINEVEKNHSEAILTSEKFKQDLFFMERILTENIFQPKLAAYRQFPVLTEPDITSDISGTVAAKKEAEQEELNKENKDKEDQKEVFVDLSAPSDLNKTRQETVAPRLEQLWVYTCDLTRGHSVSSMAWNKANPDLLAVGYGAFDFKDQKDGLVCCWSLKNPTWPERIFRCKHSVTGLDFSLANPNLLAIGLYDGSVAVYDVRNCKDAALLDCSDSSNDHSGPVWQLKWVEQNRDADGRKERLLCISADGRVTEWLLQTRLDCTDLMTIKQTEIEKKNLPSEKERKNEALLCQHAAGMCFDFHPKDTNLYLAGTEEGHIHRCSCLCKGQFLETYRGHKGPVYKVAWNPFSTEMFLSCSADWTIMLWHQDSQTPVLTFHSTSDFVHDVTWSPKSAFTFAAVKKSRAEIWDLSASILNPTISCLASPGVTFMSVLFANNTNCILVGDSEGEVTVFELQNLAVPNSSEVATLEDVIAPAVVAKQHHVQLGNSKKDLS